MWPLIHRELARTLKHKPVVWKRLLSTLIPVVITLIFLLISLHSNSHTVGRILFSLLFFIGVYHASTAPTELATALFADERQQGTLGLLFLTGLNAFEIFTAKLAGGFMIVLHRWLALLPCLLIPFLMKAVPWSACVALAETLFVWTAFCIGVNLLAAAIFEEESASRTFADLAILLLAGGGLLLGWLNQLLTGVRLTEEWMILSPGYSVWLFAKSFGSLSTRLVHPANLVTLVFAALLIIGAGVMMARSWQQREFTPASRRSLRARFLRWARSRRQVLAERWLESEPYAWLAARKADPFLYSWLFVGGVLSFWCIALAVWGRHWLLPINLWATAVIISSGLRWMLHYAAVRQISEDRSTGTLELLLTSSLPVEKIVSGQHEVLRRQVRPLFRIIALIYTVFFILGAFGQSWPSRAAFSYCCIWILVAAVAPWTVGEGVWRTFWMALNTGRPGFALRKFLFQGMGFISLGVQIFLNARKLAGLPYGTEFELWICGLGALGVVMFFIASGIVQKPSPFRARTIAELREIAPQPIPDPSDPRLKSWNGDASLFKDRSEKILV